MARYSCEQCRDLFERRSKQDWWTAMTYVPSFSTKGELRRHGEIVHGQHSCALCVFRFETRMGRQRHMYRSHALEAADVMRLVPGGGRLQRTG